ncbi:histidine--tRNA ligase [Candidatus Woesearchaeota archaeon]|nr:histidine--tRNA ligase [Candidatus Woesearchaeota archaeon]
MPLQTAKGVRDIPPEEKMLKNKIVSALAEIFELYGFAPLETPMLERYETLTAKFAAGEASDALKETFKLKDQGNRELGLRFDLTVPLARFIAMNPNMKLPFKRYEVGSVFRDGPIKLGRYREFWQCDVDIIGSSSMIAEAELLAVTQAGFRKMGIDVAVKVNNRKLLQGILLQAGIKNNLEEAIIAIDKLDKIGKKGVQEELQQRGFKVKEIETVFSLIGMTLTALKSKVKQELALQGLKEIEELMSYLKALEVNVVLDLSLARGFAYYTGTVFEAYDTKGQIASSLAAGGRYDQMIGKFLGGGREVPAVGLAFGLEPIMDLLKLRGKIDTKSMMQVYVVPVGMVKEGLNVAQQLRDAGVRTGFDVVGRGISKNLEYAGSLGIPFVVIVGENELKQNKVLLKDMTSGLQQLLSIKDVVKKVTK